jgi:hypothetical protein
MANAEELLRVLKFIEKHPHKHRQRVWHNRTWYGANRACFAGWTLLLNNQEMNDVSGKARKILGIDGETADDLFAANNSRITLRRMVEEIIARDEAALVHAQEEAQAEEDRRAKIVDAAIRRRGMSSLDESLEKLKEKEPVNVG